MKSTIAYPFRCSCGVMFQVRAEYDNEPPLLVPDTATEEASRVQRQCAEQIAQNGTSPHIEAMKKRGEVK